MPPQNKPDLVAKALAKAQSVEARLNALIGTGQDPNQPSVMYSTPATTVITQGTSGDYTWTCPPGVTAAYVECWGAGAGAGGGGTIEGGEGGGGGGYSAEPAYAVVPGTVYSYHVGNGGTGGTTGHAGTGGDASWFDTNSGAGVLALGGSAGGSYIGGPGGSFAGGNTVTYQGGNGGGDNTQSTGGCGGGGSGGGTGSGGSGTSSVSTTGTAGGAAGTGGGAAGGAGGNSGANGGNGAAPGGGGGGCGAATGSSQVTFTYMFTSAAAYYGSDAAGGNANKIRAGNSTMYQGGETASGGTYNGTQKSLLILPSSVASDLSGVTIDSVSLKLVNIHSWYNSGMTVILGYTGFTFCGPTWNGTGITSVNTFHVNEGATLTQSLTGTGLGAALKSGAARSISLGPGPAYNLNNYGYFYGVSGGSPPVLTVTGHTAGAQAKAGDGADGQVRITYTPAVTTPVASMQPAAVTDPVSSAALPAGLAAQAVTLFGAAAPSAMAGNAVHYASAQGTPYAMLPSGLSGPLVISQTDTGTYPVTQTTGTPLTKTWSIQAGDANPGTVYRLTAAGYGTWGATQQILTLQLNFGTTNEGQFLIGAVALAPSATFQWRIQGEIAVATAAGTSGTYYGALSGVIAQRGVNEIGGSSGNTVAVAGSGAGTNTFNPAIANNFLLAASWASTTGASTITGYYNTLERLGP